MAEIRAGDFMEAKAYWVGLSRVYGLGPKRFQLLMKHFGSPERVWRSKEAELAQVLGRTSPVVQNLLQCRATLDLEKELADLRERKIQVLTLEDAAYPVNLLQIYDPPPVLYVKGALAPEDAKAVAVVGSRRATPYGKAIADQLAYDLAQAGITVVSGLARGVDTCGHRGALRCGGRTLAVLGCGADVVYPRENRELFEEIAAKGAIISEFPLGTPPEATNFPVRNRIISGLSLGILVVEAAEDGGALITADFALEQGRDVFAVPGAITNRYSRGTNRLIKEGAKLVEGVADILEEYPAIMLAPQSAAPEQLSFPLDPDLNSERSDEKKKAANRPAAKARTLANLDEPDPAELSPAEKQLLSRLSLEPVVVDKLIADSGLTPSQVISILMFLEMRGLVQQLPGRRYVLGKNFI